MSLYLRSTTVATAGVVLIGAAAYAVYKTGALRPVAVGVVRGSMKAADWICGTYRTVSANVMNMVEEAKKDCACTARADAGQDKAKKPGKAAAKPIAQPSN